MDNDARSTILVGDMRERLAELDECSVDAVVTDPPYHLTTGKKGGSGPASLNENSPAGRSRIGTGFMGMKWDGGDVAMRPETWAAALRVAKPGAHLVAFAGTRTFHRIWCAIEDAGWEIRDTLMWLYGSGFPKSRNVGCRCDRPDVSRVSVAVQGLREDAAPREGADVLSDVQRQAPIFGDVATPSPSDAEGHTAAGGGPQGSGQLRMEGRRDVQEGEGQLHRSEVRALPERVCGDGEGGRVRDGASLDRGEASRTVPDEARGCSPSGSRPEEQHGREPRAIRQQQRAQARGSEAATCRRCGGLIDWTGWGTALKPAFEPIVLARKPLVGTVVQNLEQHRTGALNIDACRVPVVDRESYSANASGDRGHEGTRDHEQRGATDFKPGGGSASELGRWPANVLHDGSDEVVAAFPSEAGAQAPVFKRNGDKFRSTYGEFKGDVDEQGSTFHGDSGSAARFFWCPKATRKDRNEGLEWLDKKPLNWSSGEQSPGTFQAAGTERNVENHHPTVKPTELMRYLIRLVTPRDGLVLDPFAGSGSTGKAAALEGMRFIGVELDPEYAEIARKRVKFASGEF